MALTLIEQRKLVRAIPAKYKTGLKKHCRSCEQGGAGFFDVLKSAGNWLGKTLGPIARQIGPVVLKELVVPMISKKLGMGKPKKAGSGLRPMGAGLRTMGGPRGRR
jgi:hypothetical protein